MDNRFVYLDNNATTQVAPEVFKIMANSQELFGNASSMHGFGRAAAIGISKARKSISSLIGCKGEDLIFTSGATESNNMIFNTAKELIDQKDF